MFESLDISVTTRVRPQGLRLTRFIVDVNLEKLARLLRMLGFDAEYANHWSDSQIVQKASGRIILTRDKLLLTRKVVTHGYYVRAVRPEAQAIEVLRRLDLSVAIHPLHQLQRVADRRRQGTRGGSAPPARKAKV